jgi:hypothetical protein
MNRLQAAHALGIVLVAVPGALWSQQQRAFMAPPMVMHWCAQHCTTLRWNNGHYGGGESTWVVEQWSRAGIVIRRTDIRPYPGVAVLTGMLSADGNHIEGGTIRWTYHPCCGLSAGSFQAAWGAAINTVPGSDQERAQAGQRQPQVRPPSAAVTSPQPVSAPNSRPARPPPPGWRPLPEEIHFCAANCMTLKLQTGHYVVDDPNLGSTWTIKSFTPESVILERPWSRMEWDATYAGKISAEGNSLVDVTVNDKPDPNAHFTWGSALDQTPRNNAERNRRNAANQPPPKPPEDIKAAAAAALAAANTPAPFVAGTPLPKQMRFCDSRCYTLILNRNHYEAFVDGNTNVNDVDSIYNVIRFSRDGIELYRNDRLEFGIVTGRMEGDTLADGHIEWYRHGGTRQKTACELTWGATLTQAKPVVVASAQAAAPRPPASTGSALADALLAGFIQADKEHPLGREIDIPRDATPFFKKLPDDVRAILQPESALLPGQHGLPCASNGPVEATEALEIGRYAMRAGELVRGRCWLQRSAQDGNVRAKELLAVAYIFGLGLEKNEHSGYVLLENVWESTRDLWSYQLVSKCLENGIGTPVNKLAAERLQWALAANEQGRELVMSIGADDAEARRRFARINLMMFPPVKHEQDCNQSARIGCHDRVVVDQDAYDQQMQEINGGTKADAGQLRRCIP